MKIIHTIAGVQVDHGGTSRSVPATINALADHGGDVHLLAGLPSDANVKSSFPRDPQRISTVQESAVTGRWLVGKQFEARLVTLVTTPEETILHDHGLWLPSNRAVARFATRRGVARIVSPRGMLGEWSLKHRAWKKRLAWRLFQQEALHTAAAFHATSQQEADEIRRLGFTQPIAVIPNGIEVPDPLPSRDRAGVHRQALFLSRIHPKKGLLPLVRAWKQTADAASNWRLAIAGPDEGGHRTEVQQEIKRLDLTNQIKFIGPLDDRAKWEWYVNSELFVLPSFNENFGIVIAEALAAGLPVLTTTGTPWSVLQERSMGWWVEPTEMALAHSLRQALTMPAEQLFERGQRGQAYVRAAFTWPSVAEQLLKLYVQVINTRSERR